MNKRTRNLLLLGVLLLAVVALSGCGLPQGEVDLNNPPGLWEAIIVYPLVRLLMLLNGFISGLGIPYSWGWAIILLTLLLKLITLPLTRKQLKSTKATQELQPKLAELQAKYGKDRQKLSEEQMKLYKEAGVNPMGGCLPLLIQMPILFGLYQALYILASRPEFANADFFWIPNLAIPSQTPVTYSGVNFQGTNWISGTISTQQWGLMIAYFSLPIVMLVSQILMQKMSQPPKAASTGASQGQSQTQMMNSMMMFMPLMFGYITLGLPAGLTLYWTASNLLSMIQQYFVAGWGGLVDWFPMLKRKSAPATVPASTSPAALEAPIASSATTTTGSSASVTAPKPEKRRRRKK